MSGHSKKIIIRRGKPGDIAAIHDLVGQLAAFEQAPQSFTASLDQYRRDFESGWYRFLVAESPEGILGAAIYYPTYSTWKGRMFHLEDFIVREGYRSRGIGQRIFDVFLEEARREGCALVKWQVLDWNREAQRFYEKNGAVTDKEWWDMKIYFRDSGSGIDD